MAIELPGYFSLFSSDARIEALLKSLHSKTNLQRITDISDQIASAIDRKNHAPLLALTYVIGGKPTITNKTNGLVKLNYNSHNTLIVDGVLELVAIAKILGLNHPFEPTRKLTKQDVVSNSEIRQLLGQTFVQVTLIFNSELGLNSDDLLRYYGNYNNRESHLRSPILTSLLDNSPINDYVKELVGLANIDKFGGVARSALRLTKSDQGIVAEATLIKLVLGAIGGATPQNGNKIEDFNTHKGAFDKEAIQEAQPHIAAFIDTWLTGIREQLKNDRDGFHYSPSVWLALGLIIHHILHSKGVDIDSELQKAALKLSQINYSKSASHWANCEVMMLDAKGQEYKNASGGGRPFRAGLAKYLYRLTQG
ncbi:hypothetical protein BCT61_05480 [Vibrio breoganii]|nr:hypothetical protein BCT61_05480 [Vibrio breoganii]